jgi:ABC-type branched-subunit amino acid transport system substrate-binding protein
MLTKHQMQTVQKTTFIFVCAAFMMLAACVPNPKLPKSTTAPDVTGRFEEFFPPGSARAEAFKQPTFEEKLRMQVLDREKQQELARVQAQGQKTVETKNGNVPYKGDIKVALILPLTGEKSAMARDLQDAAMLAIYDSKNNNISGYSITLIPKDDASSPSVAAVVAQQAIAEGAKIIVGPLHSQSVETVKQVSGATPIIALSNNSDVMGENCFVFGITPEAEVARITKYIMQKDKLKFAALVPNNEYGIKLEKALKNNVTAKGGQIDTIERFIDSAHGRKITTKRLASVLRISNVETLFIADTLENSKQVLIDLKAQGVDTAALTIIGTSQWSEGDGGAIPKELKNAYFAGGNDRAFERFSQRFNAALKRMPMRISTYAYDVFSELAEIARGGVIPDKEALIAAEIIQGRAVGTYRYEANGNVARSLAVYQITDKGIEMVETAPKDF